MRQKLFQRSAVAALAFAALSAGPAWAAPHAGTAAQVATSCEHGDFAVTVRLPDASAMGGAQLVVYEANKPC